MKCWLWLIIGLWVGFGLGITALNFGSEPTLWDELIRAVWSIIIGPTYLLGLTVGV